MWLRSSNVAYCFETHIPLLLTQFVANLLVFLRSETVFGNKSPINLGASSDLFLPEKEHVRRPSAATPSVRVAAVPSTAAAAATPCDIREFASAGGVDAGEVDVGIDGAQDGTKGHQHDQNYASDEHRLSHRSRQVTPVDHVTSFRSAIDRCACSAKQYL